MLWIAEDGTTSTHWMPGHGAPSLPPMVRRARGRQRKLRQPPDASRATRDPAHNHTELPEHSEGSARPSDGAGRQLRCDVCNKRFCSAAELQSHRGGAHSEETLQRCEDCAEIFTGGGDLEKHRAKKHNKLRYPCEVCGLQYNYRSQYVIHQRTHTGEKPFCCKECGQAFGHKCSLLIHMRKHSGSSLFECGRCGKLLDTEQTLEKHRRLRFCINCKKCFTRRALRRHLKTHTPEEAAQRDPT